jgi:hypothetical protein
VTTAGSGTVPTAGFADADGGPAPWDAPFYENFSWLEPPADAGTVVLDGERIDVDCCAMRDRSWGPRTERGYRRVGCTWAAAPELSLLTFTAPGVGDREDVHAGYVRRDGRLSRITGGSRAVTRDPADGWVTALDLEVVDELGRTTTGRAQAVSRLVLPSSTSLCTNTALRWTVDGLDLHGEDQDVWPLTEWRAFRRS